MSKSIPQRPKRYHHGHKRRGSDYEAPPGRIAFSVYRPVNAEQVRDIQTKLYETARHIPGVAIHGFGIEKPPGVPLIGLFETRDRESVRDLGIDALRNLLNERIPALGVAGNYPVESVGPFGGREGNKLAIAASFGEGEGTLQPERGELGALLSEIEGWNPVHLRPSRFHASFLWMPGSTDETYVWDAKLELIKALPEELMLEKPEFHIIQQGC